MYFRLCLIALSILGRVVAIPVPTNEGEASHELPPFPIQHYNKGDIVGVRPGEYEGPGVSKDVDIHPGVVLDGPRDNGKYGIAMISKKLPHDPPQQDVKTFHPQTTLYGNVALSPEKEARPKGMKPWKSKKTGETEIPMPHAGVDALKVAMVPHNDWKEPPPSQNPPALHPGHTPTVPVGDHSGVASKPKRKRRKSKAGGPTQPTDHTASSSTHNPAVHAPQAQRKARRPAVNHQLSSSQNHSPSRAHASAHAVRGRHPYHTGSRSLSKSPAGSNHSQRGRSRSPRKSPPHHP